MIEMYLKILSWHRYLKISSEQEFLIIKKDQFEDISISVLYVIKKSKRFSVQPCIILYLHLEGCLSTDQDARVALGYASYDFYATFVLSSLPQV
jgi:hypothetical protein